MYSIDGANYVTTPIAKDPIHAPPKENVFQMPLELLHQEVQSTQVVETSHLASASDNALIIQPSWIVDQTPNLDHNDQFGVKALTHSLVEMLSNAKPPFTLSLSGAWGVGKSTVAENVVTHLRKRDIAAVKIDAWTQDVKELRRNVVIEAGAAILAEADSQKRWDDASFTEKKKKIAATLDNARTTKTEAQSGRLEWRGSTISEQYKDNKVGYNYFIAIIVLFALGALGLDKDSGLRAICISLVTSLIPILGFALGVRLVTPSVSRAPATEEVTLAAEFSRIVTRQSPNQTKPVVIVVDNLDRLSGNDALVALGQIRALVELPNSRCVFLIPIDRQKLTAHLARELGNDPIAASDYLDKLFNLDLQLAQPEPLDLHDWAYREAKMLFGVLDNADLRSLAQIAVSAAGRSPRPVTRILNGAFTRSRALEHSSQVGAIQLTFVEGLITIAPELIGHLSADPRGFIDMRAEFANLPEGVDQERVLKQYLLDLQRPFRSQPESVGADETKSEFSFDVNRLRVFLLSNIDLQLDPAQLRTALTLREDRFWKGVAGADAVVQALETGSTPALAEMMISRSEVDRQMIIGRSVEYVGRYRAYPRLVARAVDCLASKVVEMESEANRLHRFALSSLRSIEDGLLRSLGRPAIEFLFGRGQEASHHNDLRRRLYASVEGGEITTNLVVALKLVAGLLSPNELSIVRQRLASASADQISPLFEDPPSIKLAQGNVAAVMLASVENWLPGGGSQETVRQSAERLSVLRKGDWDGVAEILEVATTLSGRISDIVETPECIGTLTAIVDLFTLFDSRVEMFAKGLASQRSVGETDLFRFALRLPMTTEGQDYVGSDLSGWMSSAQPEQIKALLETNHQRVVEVSPNYRDVLLKRWEETGDMRFADAAVGGDASQVIPLQDAWERLPVEACLNQARSVLDVILSTGERTGVDSFIERICARLPSVPFDAFAGLPEIAQWLMEKQRTRQIIVGAVRRKVEAATDPGEVEAIVPAVVEAARHLDKRLAEGLANSIADTFLSHHCGQAEYVRWLLHSIAAQTTMERLLVELLERSTPLPGVVECLESARSKGLKSASVFEALVGRALRENQADSSQLALQAADRWERPSEQSDVIPNLEALKDRLPELSNQIDSLIGSMAVDPEAG